MRTIWKVVASPTSRREYHHAVGPSRDTVNSAVFEASISADVSRCVEGLACQVDTKARMCDYASGSSVSPRTFSSRGAQTFLGQFFSIGQEPHETVAQFTIRFQDLYRQVADDVSAQHMPDTFLSSLREPLQKTLALTNFAN